MIALASGACQIHKKALLRNRSLSVVFFVRKYWLNGLNREEGYDILTKYR